MNRSIATLGLGAIGSSIGADLIKAGHNIGLIDQWRAHVEAMKAQELRIIMPKKRTAHTGEGSSSLRG